MGCLWHTGLKCRLISFLVVTNRCVFIKFPVTRGTSRENSCFTSQSTSARGFKWQKSTVFHPYGWQGSFSAIAYVHMCVLGLQCSFNFSWRSSCERLFVCIKSIKRLWLWVVVHRPKHSAWTSPGVLFLEVFGIFKKQSFQNIFRSFVLCFLSPALTILTVLTNFCFIQFCALIQFSDLQPKRD